jgi:hypothetical protein
MTGNKDNELQIRLRKNGRRIEKSHIEKECGTVLPAELPELNGFL